MANCVNHPLRGAISECRKCGKPICDQCNQLNNRFCSPECANEFRDFQSRIVDTSATRRKRFSILGCLRTLIISVVLVVVIWFALQQLLGTSDPGKMLTELKRMWRLAF